MVPTLLDLAGLAKPADLAGRSLLDAREGPRTLFFELRSEGNDPTAVLAEEKVIYHRMKSGAANFVPFFETCWIEDRDKQVRVNRDTFRNRRLRQLIIDYRNADASPYRRARVEDQAVPVEVREQLRALGYLK